ncbi:hypothetical protein T4E_7074 [Trichinella pseudospiralis]|uniref:Uncharacterized protein n=1 Tax=Trichinella pseudospiralis TaxID=6337 RepID=A0A0V0YAK2_TRIPS|nr:hypothetical protein T4E_7074 [Trichinella pseudospiralis]
MVPNIYVDIVGPCRPGGAIHISSLSWRSSRLSEVILLSDTSSMSCAWGPLLPTELLIMAFQSISRPTAVHFSSLWTALAHVIGIRLQYDDRTTAYRPQSNCMLP